MKLWTKLGTIACVACLAVIPGVAKASTTLPSVKGIGVGNTGSAGTCVFFNIFASGAGAALINRVPFGPLFSATLTEENLCSGAKTGPALFSLKWSGKGQLVCRGSGTYSNTGTSESFSGAVNCQQLPHGLTYSGRIEATTRFVKLANLTTATLN
jgi:hypothetical protein